MSALREVLASAGLGAVTTLQVAGHIDAAEGRWVQTVFLDAVPAVRLDLPGGIPEEAVLDGREVFVRYPEGIGGSKLQAGWFEKRLGVTGTARNANTIAKLIALSA